MKCFHCGGSHDPDYCPGYGIVSLKQSAQGIRTGVERISHLHGDQLLQLAHVSDSLADIGRVVGASVDAAGDNISDVGDQVSEAVSWAAHDIVVAIDRGTTDVSEAVREGTQRTVGAINRATAVNAVGLIGLGALTVRAEKSICERIERSQAAITNGLDAVLETLVGIGAALVFRERMDQLRHEAELAMHEEASVAGQARRSLAAAVALLDIDPNEAYGHAARGVKAFPVAAEAYRIRGTVQSVLGRHEEAIKSFEAACKLAGQGKVTPGLGSRAQASKREIRQVFSSSYAQLASALLVTGRVDSAVDVLERALTTFSSNVDLLFLMIRALSHDVRWKSKHRKMIERLLQISPSHFNLLYVGRQFAPERRSSVRLLLDRLQEERLIRLRQKRNYLDMISEGASPWLKTSAEFLEARLPFTRIASVESELHVELDRWRRHSA